MLGNVLTVQVFTLLRELTATDYQKGVNCNCFNESGPMRNGIGNNIFYESRL